MKTSASNSRLLEASHAYCHRQTKRNARSFYFASIALPMEKKRAAYAVYAFCRYADDLVDHAASVQGRGCGFACASRTILTG